ncbi:MAG: amidohydrolase family protein [Chloroflexi bacterium]|nr:amidohydrolase family protein [Chloroflexota bacterium]
MTNPKARNVLVNANLINCVNPQPLPGASVTVEGGRIVEVLHGHSSPSTRDAQVIDLKGSYLLPGLWDVHVHLEYPRLANATVAQQTVQYGYNASQGLTEAGVVGIRTGGVPHFIDVAWKRAFDAGEYAGPRIFAGGYFLTTTGGHAIASGFARECDGPHGFVQAIREQIKNGVDHIKLNLTGGIMGPPWDRHWHSLYLPEELEAAFAICKQRGFKVMAHAANPDAVKAAVRLGAHSVEHGYIMDDECVQLLLERDVWYVPTLGISHLTPSQATTEWEKRYVQEANLAQDLAQRADAAMDEHRRWFRRALAAGVKMALGSDLRPVKQAALLEMALWVKDGATTWQTLVAATKNAAELCGAGNDLGTIEVGKLADMIVVRRNPLDDINNLRSLELVFKEGRLVADKRKEGE